MNRLHRLIAAFGIAAVALPAAASAAPWQSIDARQSRIEQRIDQGVRSGALARPEARRLRQDLRQLARREDQYRRSHGLSGWERQDLNRRFDALSARVRVEKHDRRYRR